MTSLKEEEPFVAVVDNDNLANICSKCFESKNILRRCSACKIHYYCGTACQSADWEDHKAECKLFRTAAFIPLRDVRIIPLRDVRIVARILDKTNRCPEYTSYNGRTYDDLQHHKDKLESRNPQSIKTCLAATYLFTKKKYTEEEIVVAYSKYLTNYFTITGGPNGASTLGAGLYIGLSSHDHSCRPDCWVVFEGPKMLLRSADPTVKYSEKLTVSYNGGNTIGDTRKRREKLSSQYFFNCNCDECSDTDLDRRRQSGRSECCKDGVFFDEPNTKCSACGKAVSAERLLQLQNWNKELSEQEEADVTNNLETMMNTYEKCRSVLSDQNINLVLLAEKIYPIAIIFNKLLVAKKFIDICLPMIRERMPSNHSWLALCIRCRILGGLGKQFSNELKNASEEYWEAMQLVYGKDHPLTKSLL